jgi:hypothetical protein
MTNNNNQNHDRFFVKKLHRSELLLSLISQKIERWYNMNNETYVVIDGIIMNVDSEYFKTYLYDIFYKNQKDDDNTIMKTSWARSVIKTLKRTA